MEASRQETGHVTGTKDKDYKLIERYAVDRMTALYDCIETVRRGAVLAVVPLLLRDRGSL